MSSKKQPRIDPNAVGRSATDVAIGSGRQVLGFERQEFSPFFDLQSQLMGGLQDRLAAAEAGELPAAISTAFQRALVGAQTRRGLATSPVGATEEAVGLANILANERSQAFQAAQMGLSQFRPSTGFMNPLQPAQTMGLAAQALAPRPDTRASQISNLVGLGASFIPGLDQFAPLAGMGAGALAGLAQGGNLEAAGTGIRSGLAGGIAAQGVFGERSAQTPSNSRT